MADEDVAKKALDEELIASEQYTKHIADAKSEPLRKILKHNKSDELNDHAAKLAGFLIEELQKEKRKV